MTVPVNNLAIDDDDAVDVIIEIESRFGIKFSDQEAEQILSFGDLYEAVARKLPFRRTFKCHTQMAFYRLSDVLEDLQSDQDLRPSSSLEDIIDQNKMIANQKELFHHIASKADLRLPQLGLSMKAKFAWIFVLVGAFCSLVLIAMGKWYAWPMLAMVLLVSCFSFITDSGRAHQQTLGDLAREVASLNYGKLVAKGGRHNTETLWIALCEAMSIFSDLQAIAIDRETRFLVSQK